MPTYTKLKKTHDKQGEIAFEAEIDPAFLAEHQEKMLEEVRADFEMPGFRRGQVPADIVRKHIDEAHLLEDAAYAAIRTVIRDIAVDQKLEPMSTPMVNITKLAPDNPVTLTVRMALSPSFSLPDYKKIAKNITAEESAPAISDEELENGVRHIRRIAAARMGKTDMDDLPELTPEFVKQLGPFDSVDAFKEELRKQLLDEKNVQLKQQRRDQMVGEIVKKTKMHIPDMAIAEELELFKERRDAELADAKLELDDYLAKSGKTADQLEKEERELVENQLRSRLVLREIIKKEQLEPDQHETHHMLEELRRRYGKQDEHELLRTASALALQEKLFRLLEGSETEAQEL